MKVKILIVFAFLLLTAGKAYRTGQILISQYPDDPIGAPRSLHVAFPTVDHVHPRGLQNAHLRQNHMERIERSMLWKPGGQLTEEQMQNNYEYAKQVLESINQAH